MKRSDLAGNSSIKFLLIQKDPTIRGWLGRTLEEAGFRVSMVDSLKAGVARLVNEPGFSAIISDYYLSDGTCLDLLGELVNHKTYNVPVLLLTTRCPTEPLPGLGLAVLASPFDSAQLLTALQQLVRFDPPVQPRPDKVSHSSVL
ncbi:MAG: hypothetical protein ACYDH9_06635 [Limisphaerales bacterium]